MDTTADKEAIHRDRANPEETSSEGGPQDIHPLTGKPREYAELSEQDGIDWDEIVYELENDPNLEDGIMFDPRDYATDEEFWSAVHKWLWGPVDEVERGNDSKAALDAPRA